jgi:hypothetical protein
VNVFESRRLFVPSGIDVDDEELFNDSVQFVQGGGGLSVFYSHPMDGMPLSMPINRLLVQFGLEFALCILRENLGHPDVLAVPPLDTAVREAHFIPICEHFRAVLKQENTDPAVRDDLVAVLRDCGAVSDSSCSAALHEIRMSAWDLLKRTGHLSDGLFCPNLRDGIIVVVLRVTDGKPSDHEIFRENRSRHRKFGL